MKSLTFAYLDTLFCTYADNFIWNISPNSECLFPSRSIFLQKNTGDTLQVKMAYALDLFGIPRD